MFVSSKQVRHLVKVAEHCKKQDVACVLKDHGDKVVRLPGLAQGVWSGAMLAVGVLTGGIDAGGVEEDADSALGAAMRQYAEGHAAEIAERLGLDVEEVADDDD